MILQVILGASLAFKDTVESKQECILYMDDSTLVIRDAPNVCQKWVADSDFHQF